MSEEWKIDNLVQDSFEENVKRIESKIEEFKQYKENLSEDITPEELKEIIELKEKINVECNRLSAYYQLKFSENTDNQEALAKMSRLSQIGSDWSNEMLFFSMWFIKLDEEKADELINSEELEEYKYYLEQLKKEKPHTRSEEEEKLLTIKSSTGGDAFSDFYEVMTNQFTYEFQGEEKTKEEVLRHARKSNPELREKAYKTVLSKYKENNTVLAEIYKNIVLDWRNEGLKIRNFEAPMSVRNFSNDIEDKAVEALLETIQENMDVFRDYFKTKYNILTNEGQDYPYSRYHLYAPYKVDKDYSYEEAKEKVLETFREFDERFYQNAQRIFEEEHVHSHPEKNKRGGAFCMAIETSETPYLLLNHTGDLGDVFTMAHEFGHGIHYLLSKDKPDLLWSASLPMAETASVFSEMILARKMLEESEDDEEKKALLIHLLDNQYGAIGRQAYFTFFEQESHERIAEGATKEELNQVYMENLEEQFGGMEIPEVFKHEWNYVPHFHASPFYCYAYSWGNLLTLSLYSMYEEEGGDFKEKYIDLLSQGGSKSPKELLAQLNIDPTDKDFWQKGFDVVKEELDELKSLTSE